ncbi:MAG: hypothetical protein IJB61_02840 [Bacteroides sp]|nr:hypothetical protein [Bacteroides sp.]
MKKKLKALGVLMVAVVAAYNVYASHVESEYSDVILANVEALAEGEDTTGCSGVIYVCISKLASTIEEMQRNCSGSFNGSFNILDDC